jgi:hypothetical protein
MLLRIMSMNMLVSVTVGQCSARRTTEFCALFIRVSDCEGVKLSRDQNAGQSHNIKIDKIYFERTEEFKYLESTIKNLNSIREEIKTRLQSGNACCHSVKSILPSSLLSKNLEIEIYRTIILPVVLHGCETWSLTLREESRLRMFENRVLRGIFWPKRDEVTGEWRKLHNQELRNLYCSPNIVRVIK